MLHQDRALCRIKGIDQRSPATYSQWDRGLPHRYRGGGHGDQPFRNSSQTPAASYKRLTPVLLRQTRCLFDAGALPQCEGLTVQERLIRHIRESLGFTQQEFAASLGISQATVSRWEAGRVSPDIEMRRRIHDLARKDRGMVDAPLFALIRRSPSYMALLDMDMRVMALSDTAAALHRLSAREACGVNYRPFFSEDLEEAYNQSLAAGFFTGNTLNVDLCCRMLTLQGETVYMRGTWHIVHRPSNGHPLLIWQGEQISEAEYLSTSAEQGVVRVVGLHEWLEDGMPNGSQIEAVA